LIGLPASYEIVMSVMTGMLVKLTYLCLDLVPNAPVRLRYDDSVRDKAEHAYVHALLSRGKHLRHGAHADDVCTCGAEEAALRRRLIRRPADPCVCALRQVFPREPELVGRTEDGAAERG
jgi:hypothetical protein